MTAIDRIRAVADAQYATELERREAIKEARAQEVSDYIKDLTFPYQTTVGKSTVRISSPRRVSGGIRFNATVRVDGVLVHREEHVIINPPLLVSDENGDVTIGSGERARKFRFDPMACVVNTVLEAVK